MRILQMISSGGMYGAESVILNLSRTLNRGVHRCLLGVFENYSNPNLQLHRNACREGIESYLIPCRGQIDRGAITTIRKLATQTGADVLHAHGYKADIYAYVALRTRGIPLVSTCHNWIENDISESFYGAVDRFVLRRFSRVVAVSDDVKRRLLLSGVRSERIRQIRNGIDLRPFDCALPSLRCAKEGIQSVTIGWVGRLSKEKGADVFIRSAAHVLRDFPNADFVIVGDGPDRSSLENLIEGLNLNQTVSMLGRRDDMPEVFASLDIMVSSSRQEGLPIAILEAMASGLPLVATAVGEVPTLVKDGHTGVLVQTEDPSSLAAAIISLLRDSEQRRRLGSAARRMVEEEFSAERMTADYVQIYEEAIALATKGKAAGFARLP